MLIAVFGIDTFIEVVKRSASRCSRSARQTAGVAGLHNVEGDQTSPSSLMGGAQPSSVICVEELMEPNKVSEMRIAIQFDVPAISSATPIHIATEDVNDTMLNLLGHFSKVHIISATGWTFDLELRAVVLVESLE